MSRIYTLRYSRLITLDIHKQPIPAAATNRKASRA